MRKPLWTQPCSLSLNAASTKIDQHKPASAFDVGLPPAPTGQKVVTGAQKLIVQKRSGAVRGRLRKWARNISCGATVRR
jgi:hypothetical protein